MNGSEQNRDDCASTVEITRSSAVASVSPFRALRVPLIILLAIMLGLLALAKVTHTRSIRLVQIYESQTNGKVVDSTRSLISAQDKLFVTDKFSDGSGRLAAYDLEGVLQWELPFPEGLNPQFGDNMELDSSGNPFVVTTDNKMVALDQSGKQLWELEPADCRYDPSCLNADEVFTFNQFGGVVTAVLSNGTKVWQTPLHESTYNIWHAGAQLDATLYVEGEQHLFMLDITGEVLGSVPLAAGYYVPFDTLPDGRFAYYDHSLDSMLALDRDGNTSTMWTGKPVNIIMGYENYHVTVMPDDSVLQRNLEGLSWTDAGGQQRFTIKGVFDNILVNETARQIVLEDDWGGGFISRPRLRIHDFSGMQLASMNAANLSMDELFCDSQGRSYFSNFDGDVFRIELPAGQP